MNTKVVQLKDVRDLKAQMEVLDKEVSRGRAAGWIGMVMDGDGVETVYLGGVYGADTTARLKAVLKMSKMRLEVEEGLHRPPLRLAKQH